MYIYMCPSLSISVHNDIEMKGEPDTVSLPIPNCVAKDIFSSPIKEDDERNIFGFAPAAITDSAAAAAAVAAPDAPASQNPDSIGDSDDVDIEDDSDENGTSAGGGEGIDENVASGESNNNENNFTNNNNNNNNNNLMKRKLKDIVDEQADDEYDLARPPPKRVSPFLNTPKQRKDERKRILRLSVYKLREMEDPESFLRKSVLVNNVLRRLHKEIREEKRGYAGFGLGSATMAMSHPYYRPRRFDYDMLNNSHLPTRSAFFFDEPCFPGETEKITDDMTDSLVRSLEASSPPLSPVPTPPPSPSPTSNLLMSTPTQSPLTLSPLSSPSSSSSTLQLPGSPYPGIPSASTAASTSLSSPLTITTATDGAVLATTATAIPTIITTTRLPSQLSSTSSTTASTRIPSASEEMLLANDHSSRNAISIFTNSSSSSGSSTVLANTRALSSRITQNGITISRCTSSLTSTCSNNLSFVNKSTDTSRTIKPGTPNNSVTDGSGCSTTSDNNNNNDTVCNANGSHVFGTSGTTDHASVSLATSRTPGLHSNSNSDITSTNSPVLFSTTNFGTSGFVSASGLTPNSSFSCFVSSTTTTTTTTTSPTMNTSSANSMTPSIAFPEKQLPVEMDTMFNNLISVLGET